MTREGGSPSLLDIPAFYLQKLAYPLAVLRAEKGARYTRGRGPLRLLRSWAMAGHGRGAARGAGIQASSPREKVGASAAAQTLSASGTAAGAESSSPWKRA